MSAATRFVIEGTWSGYTSSQHRVVHCSVHPRSRKSLRAWAERTHAIRYTDGTSLYISVRDAKPREKVKEQRSYMDLIEKCVHYDVCDVTALGHAEASARLPGSAQRREA